MRRWPTTTLGNVKSHLSNNGHVMVKEYGIQKEVKQRTWITGAGDHNWLGGQARKGETWPVGWLAMKNGRSVGLAVAARTIRLARSFLPSSTRLLVTRTYSIIHLLSFFVFFGDHDYLGFCTCTQHNVRGSKALSHNVVGVRKNTKNLSASSLVCYTGSLRIEDEHGKPGPKQAQAQNQIVSWITT